MELLRAQSGARKSLLLNACQTEVLVLSSPRLIGAWSDSVVKALGDCARRGLAVRILLERGPRPDSATLAVLREAGAEIRQVPRPFSWILRTFPVHSESWIFDRAEALTVNERVPSDPFRQNGPALQVECTLGTEAALGLASYFDRRWEAETHQLAFSVRHKSYAFHSGRNAELEFFECLLAAQESIVLCLPGGRVSRRVERALHVALREGLRVQIYTNAERDDAPGIRRLRRLSIAGALVKICGNRLRSEGAVLDEMAVYLGSLPTSWHPLRRASCPVFVMRDRAAARDLLSALEAQVSVEIAPALTPSLA